MDIEFSQAVDQLQEMLNDFVRGVPRFILALFIFFLFFYLAKFVQATVVRVADRSGRSKNIGLVLGRLVQWFVVLLGFLIAAVIVFPNFSPAQIIELLGIGAVAIGFAFRDILQNFFSGILLLFTEPFGIGDQIITGKFEGTVEDIQTRATMIRTYDGRRVVIPNADLFTDSVIVNTAYSMRRMEHDIGIGYGDEIEEAKRLILEALNEIEDVLRVPAPDVLVTDLAESSVILRVRWWIEPPRRKDTLITRGQILSAIKDMLLLNGIDLPFQTYQVLFHNQTEEADGDRARQREGWPASTDDIRASQRDQVS